MFWKRERAAENRTVRSSPSGPLTHDQARLLLGLGYVFSAAQLKTAWKQKVSEWHPDKLDGMAEELRGLATERVKQLNEAHAILKSATADLQEASVSSDQMTANRSSINASQPAWAAFLGTTVDRLHTLVAMPVDQLEALANGGEVGAICAIAIAYQRGWPGTEKDVVKAAAWYKKLPYHENDYNDQVDEICASADMETLMKLWQAGIGEAGYYLAQAAEEDESCWILDGKRASEYEFYEAFLPYYWASANCLNARAIAELAEIYQEGKGTEVDLDKARQLAEAATKSSDEFAIWKASITLAYLEPDPDLDAIAAIIEAGPRKNRDSPGSI